MKGWIIGFVLLCTAILVINCERFEYEDDDVYLERRKFSSNPPRGSVGMLEIPDEADDEDKEDDEEMSEEPAIKNGEKPAGVFIRDPTIKGGAGILIIQNGPSSSLPLMFELRPMSASDTQGPFIDIDDDDMEASSEDDEGSDDNNVIYVADNRFKPNGGTDGSDWTDDEDYEDQDPVPTKRPNRPNRPSRPTKKPKRKPSNQVSNPNRDRDSQRPSKRPKRPVSQQNTNKRRKNKNKVQNQNQNNSQNKNKNKNKNKNQNQNKNKNPNRRRKPNNQQKRPQQSPNRRKNNGNRKVFQTVNRVSNRRKHVGVNVRKDDLPGTVTNTMTTTQTGPAAGDEPNVNYIIINKPTPAPTSTTERPFWDILGRRAGDGGIERSFNPRRGFQRRSLG